MKKKIENECDKKDNDKFEVEKTRIKDASFFSIFITTFVFEITDISCV